MLSRLLKGLSKKRNSSVDYEEAREMLQSENEKARSELAKNEQSPPEALYYLAEDQSEDVRKSVAANSATPIQAQTLLADDTSDDVRYELASKITRLLPGLSEGETEKIREMTISVIEKLAEDQVPRVRQIISEELKDSHLAPPNIIKKLAHDVELAVCGPVLEFSPLLSDDDLLEVIASSRVEGALERIASRAEVGDEVSDAVVATLDVPGVAALLSNPNAQIREETLDRIIDNAEAVEEWHRPVAMRPEHSLRTLRRIAGFVAFSILEEVSKRNDLDEDVQSFLKKKVRERIEHEQDLEPDFAESHEKIVEEVNRLAQAGHLDDECIGEAIDCNRREFLIEALAHLVGEPAGFVERILSSKNGKAVTALSWKASLSMRIALKLQTHISHVPPKEQIMAREGIYYPLNEDEMEWQLDYFRRQS